jgi:hypothetical protein
VIVDAIRQRDDLLIKLRLARLLDPGVQVADVGGEGDDGFAVDLDDKAENAVRRRVLRTHVDDHGLVLAWRVLAIAAGISDDVFNAGVDRLRTCDLFKKRSH